MFFWRLYMAVFTFIFPLFFIYAGIWKSSALHSTIALAVGIVLWLGFIYKEFKRVILNPIKVNAEIKNIYNNTHHTIGKVLKVFDITKGSKTNKAYLFSFPNFIGTQVNAYIDDKEGKYNFYEGQNLSLLLNKSNNPHVPFIIDDNNRDVPSAINIKGFIYLIFIATYALGFFLVCYFYYSEKDGWRFLSLWHPWVWAPLIGILGTFVFSLVDRTIARGSNSIKSNKIALYGKVADGEIINRDHTGTIVMNVPLMKFDVKFKDQNGIERLVTIKELVPFNDLYKFELDRRPVLYLPEDSTQAKFMHIEKYMTSYANKEPSAATLSYFDYITSD